MKLEKIKEYWEKSGNQFSRKSKVTPTSKDPYLSKLEEKNILSFLNKNQVVLEIGCGDGSHTVKYARKVRKLFGVDIAEPLLKIAKKRILAKKIRNVDLLLESVLNLKRKFNDLSFDCVISQRCLINLSNWSNQRNVINQIHHILKRGGLFLLTEGFQEELDYLNSLREKVGLSKIKIVSFNKFICRSEFERLIKPYFKIVSVGDYGLYIFLSRFYHPLAIFPQKPKHDSKLNDAAMKISENIKTPGFEKYSYNLFYALKKK